MLKTALVPAEKLEIVAQRLIQKETGKYKSSKEFEKCSQSA